MKNVMLLVVAMLLGALARDLVVSRAQADANVSWLITRSDVNAIVRALERQAEATRDLVSATKERCR